MDKKHQEIITSPDGFKMTDSVVGVRDNGDGSFSDLRFTADQILAFVNNTTPALNPPVLSNPAVESTQATVSGTAVSGADYYEVQTSTNSNFTGAASVNTTTWPKVITGLTNGTLYYFRSRAVNSQTTGDWSNTVSVTPAAGSASGLTFHFGSITAGSLPTESEIEALTTQAIPSDHTKVITFPNTTDDTLCFAYPATETDPTTYYIGPLDNGTLGSGGTFAGPVTVGAYRVIISNYPTQIPTSVTFS